MCSKIRAMSEKDKEAVIEMMRVFYNSPAVFTDGSEKIFSNDVENCINDNPYLDGFVVEYKNEIQGYAMVAKSFSTEFGKSCIWIEDIYVKEKYRGQGIGRKLMNFILDKYDECIFRLEAEKENERAISLYEKCGFDILPYMEMKNIK